MQRQHFSKQWQYEGFHARRESNNTTAVEDILPETWILKHRLLEIFDKYMSEGPLLLRKKDAIVKLPDTLVKSCLRKNNVDGYKNFGLIDASPGFLSVLRLCLVSPDLSLLLYQIISICKGNVI